MDKAKNATLLEIGIISRPHGITGEVKVQTSPEFLTALEGIRRVHLDNSPDTRRIESHRIHQNAILLKLEGVSSRTDAEALRGVRISIRTRELPKLGEGEYYSHELVGLHVLDETEQTVGEIREVLATGSNDVYVIAMPDGKELLLPAIDSVIRKIDLDTRVMNVVIPDGLRD
jgi:16S rRNA processing protein RimM